MNFQVNEQLLGSPPSAEALLLPQNVVPQTTALDSQTMECFNNWNEINEKEIEYGFSISWVLKML